MLRLEEMSLEELQQEARRRDISIRGRNRFQLKELLKQDQTPVGIIQKTKGERKMLAGKWSSFFAGATVVLNGVALALLVLPLGMPPAVIRGVAASVIGFDLLIEIALFVRS